MGVREITFKGEDRTILYACDQCGSVHSPKSYACQEERAHQIARQSADDCCKPRACTCGTPIQKYQVVCRSCHERRGLQKATIIAADSYSGPVSADCRGEWGEGYSSSLSALLEWSEEFDEVIPAYCYPCTSEPLRLDIERIIESACEEHHEDAQDHVVGFDELAAAIDAFNRAQTCVTYFGDRSRFIVIDQGRFDALIAEPDLPESRQE